MPDYIHVRLRETTVAMLRDFKEAVGTRSYDDSIGCLFIMSHAGDLISLKRASDSLRERELND